MPSTALPEIALDSFANDFTAVVVGASGGVGGALFKLWRRTRTAAASMRSRSGQTAAQGGSAKIMQARMDVANPDSIESGFAAVGDKLDLVICATGVLHGDAFGPEKSWRQIEAEAFSEVLAVNVTGPAWWRRLPWTNWPKAARPHSQRCQLGSGRSQTIGWAVGMPIGHRRRR